MRSVRGSSSATTARSQPRGKTTLQLASLLHKVLLQHDTQLHKHHQAVRAEDVSVAGVVGHLEVGVALGWLVLLVQAAVVGAELHKVVPDGVEPAVVEGGVLGGEVVGDHVALIGVRQSLSVQVAVDVTAL